MLLLLRRCHSSSASWRVCACGVERSTTLTGGRSVLSAEAAESFCEASVNGVFARAGSGMCIPAAARTATIPWVTAVKLESSRMDLRRSWRPLVWGAWRLPEAVAVRIIGLSQRDTPTTYRLLWLGSRANGRRRRRLTVAARDLQRGRIKPAWLQKYGVSHGRRNERECLTHARVRTARTCRLNAHRRRGRVLLLLVNVCGVRACGAGRLYRRGFYILRVGRGRRGRAECRRGSVAARTSSQQERRAL